MPADALVRPSLRRNAPAGTFAVAVTVAGAVWAAGAATARAAAVFTVSGVTVVDRAGASPLREEQQRHIALTLARLPAPLLARRVIIQRGPGVACAADGLPDGDDWWDAATNTVRLCDGRERDLPRQLALAVLFAFDAGQPRGGGWSATAAWRSMAGWRTSPFSVWRPFPENGAPGAHAGTGIGAESASPDRALRSPRWDLVTFGVAAFLDEATDDDAVVCQLPDRAAFLRKRLRALGMVETALPTPTCHAFEQWADLDALEDVELVLAAPSNAMVGSMFGHLFLRLRYRTSDGEIPLEAGRTVAFLADNDAPFGDDPAYAVKGIFGRYAATLHERPFLSTYREYAILEGRDLRRWRLELTPAQRRRLLEGVWSLQRAGSYRYYFFARNCATLLVELLNGALELSRPITIPGVLAAPPSSIVEQFEAARTARGQPLARYVPQPILALEHQARAAATRRRAAEARLLVSLPAALRSQAAASFRGSHSADAGERAQAYHALAPLLVETGESASAAAEVHRFLRASALLESYLSTVANLEEEQRVFAARRTRLRAAVGRLAAALRASAAPGAPLALATAEITDDDRQRRLDGYQRLASHLPGLERTAPETGRQARLLVLLQSEVRYDVTRMKAVPGLRDALLFVERQRRIEEQPYLVGGEGQPVTGAEASALLALPVVTRVAPPLRALQATKQAVFTARPMAVTDEVLRDEGEAAPSEGLARAHDEALPRSGIDQVVVLGGVLASTSGAAGARFLPARLDAGVVLGGALYDERLGEHRRFGFPSHTAFTVARTAALVTWDGGDRWPRFAAHDARWLGYRTLRPTLPEGGGTMIPWGWELWLDSRGNAAQALAAAVSGGWGLLLRLWERDELSDHLLVTAGVAYEATFPTAAAVAVTHPQVVGAPLGVELRRGLGVTGRRSHLSLRAFARPAWIAWGAPSRVAVDGGGTVECQLAARRAAQGGAHDPALVLAFQVLRSSLGLTATGPALQAMFSLGVALR